MRNGMKDLGEVNPARAGMILTGCIPCHTLTSKPRASGDDPTIKDTASSLWG